MYIDVYAVAKGALCCCHMLLKATIYKLLLQFNRNK